MSRVGYMDVRWKGSKGQVFSWTVVETRVCKVCCLLHAAVMWVLREFRQQQMVTLMF